MPAVGWFNSQLSHLSKIPFESLSPLPGRGETHMTSFGSEQQVQVCVCVCLCVCLSVRQPLDPHHQVEKLVVKAAQEEIG